MEELLIQTEAGAEPFRINNEERAVWAVDKLNTFDERLARLDAQYQAMRKQIADDKASFEGRFLLDLEDWAKANPPKKGKSIKLLTGTLGFRSVKGGPRVVDKDAVIAWASSDEIERGSFLAYETVVKVNTDAVKDYVASTGEIIPGVEIKDDEERFYVKGAKADE